MIVLVRHTVVDVMRDDGVMATKRDDIVEAATQLIKRQGVHAASISGMAASGIFLPWS